MAHRIDTHQHLVPPAYAQWLNDRGIRPGGINLPAWSPSRALRFMDRHDVAAAVLSLSTPGVHLGDAAEARTWARTVNEYTADVVRDSPGRFGFFATLTLPDVDGSLTEAQYALDVLGADGVVLLANNHGRYLGDREFEPLLEYLHERRTVAFVHPGELPADPVPGIPTFVADFLLDTTRSAISLTFSGALEKFDGIRFILAHAGGFLPYISYRVMLAMTQRATRVVQVATVAAPDRLVPHRLSVLRRFYFDTALSSTPAALPSLLEIADPERVLHGTDFPFAPPPAVRLMNHYHERVPLSESVRRSIEHRAAARLFPGLAGRLRP